MSLLETCQMDTNKTRAFILIECLNALVMCAFALLLLFSLVRFSSHRLGMQKAEISSLHDILSADLIPCNSVDMKISHKTFAIQSCVVYKDSSLPYSLHFLKVQQARK